MDCTKFKVNGILILFFCVSITACYPTYDEVARVSSPNGLVDAVLVETNGGATTSFGYVVFLETDSFWGTKQTKVGHLYGAIRSDNAYGVNLVWVTGTTLQLEYLKTQDIFFRLTKVEVADIDFKILFRSGIYDPDAPSGGMHYNLMGRPKLQ